MDTIVGKLSEIVVPCQCLLLMRPFERIRNEKILKIVRNSHGREGFDVELDGQLIFISSFRMKGKQSTSRKKNLGKIKESIC